MLATKSVAMTVHKWSIGDSTKPRSLGKLMGDKEVQGCARKCVATCIRGGGGKLHCHSLSKDPKENAATLGMPTSVLAAVTLSIMFPHVGVSLRISAAARTLAG